MKAQPPENTAYFSRRRKLLARFGRLALGLALAALSGSRAWAAGGTPVMLVHDYSPPGHELSMITLVEREDDAALVPAAPDLSLHSDYVDRLAAILQRWTAETYVEHGIIERGDRLYRGLLAPGALLDGRSIVIAITERNDLARIRSVVRISTLGTLPRNRLAPMEHQNPDVLFDRPEPRWVEVGGQLLVDGEFGEIKSFIQARDAEWNYLGALLWRATQSGAFQHSFRSVYFDGELRPLMPRFYRVVTHRMGSRLFQRDYGFVPLPEVSDPRAAVHMYMEADLAAVYAAPERAAREEPGRKPPVPLDPSALRLLSWEPAPLPGGGPDGAACATGFHGSIPFYAEPGPPPGPARPRRRPVATGRLRPPIIK